MLCVDVGSWRSAKFTVKENQSRKFSLDKVFDKTITTNWNEEAEKKIEIQYAIDECQWSACPQGGPDLSRGGGLPSG